MKVFNGSLTGELTGSARELAGRIESRDAVIGVVGLGYVGLPIALEFAKQGFRTVGVDVSRSKVERLNRGENFIEDLDDAEVAEAVGKGFLRASATYDALREADVIYIAVPTPFNANKDPDLAYIIQAGQGIATILSEGKLIILKSTTFPGTTEHYLIPELNASGLTAGVDYFIAFSPERVDPGNKVFHTRNTPIVTGGLNRASTIVAAYVNSQIIDTVYMVDNPRVAELEKLFENIFRSVNIALVNELALLCERMGGIDVWEVIEAAGTKPFGYMKFTPGPGVGGHCIPIDPYYLSWLAREYDFETRFITLAANVNEGMPYHVCNHVIREIARQPITLDDARVLILGASFKKNVKDLRHSPSEFIMLRLMESGVQHIDYSDPWAPEYHVAGRPYYSVDLSPETVADYHVVVMVTDHDDFDIEMVVKHARAIVDTRNMTRDYRDGRDHVTVIGVSEPRARYALEH
jgi:UDP-N-acetyl-D-glucosamine dehydrogenase